MVGQRRTRDAPRAPMRGGVLRRKCDCGQHTGGGTQCGGCAQKREKLLRRSAIGGGGHASAPPVVHEVLRSPGRPLDSSPRSFMEQRFGQDFSQVRVHTGARASESARSVGALAYTVGRDMVFAEGQYAPGTSAGDRLLAHELTHVLQQGETFTGTQTKLVVGAEGDAAEREADRTAEAVVSGRGVVPQSFAAPAPAPALRRVCGPGPVGSPPGCAPRSPTFVTGGSVFKFNKDCDDFTSAAEEASLRALPATLPAAATVEIHGFASDDGDPAFNDPLSCARAVRAETVLAGGGLAPSRLAGRFQHGGTPGPAAERRSVVVLPVTPAPPPPLTTHRFRASAASFLSCAECNPFTDDGALGLAPPAREPAPGTSFRQVHFVEAELGTTDGRTIAPGTARLAGSGIMTGMSHFCGSGAPGHVVSRFPPLMTPVADPVHGQGVQFQSVLTSRVGASVPATLPGAPCGPLGTNPLIPVIGNTFQMRLFADGHKDSNFVSATLYPSHYLYEDRALKVNAAGPVHPRQDFYAWATQTAPYAAAVIGFKAMRFHCCHPTMATLMCPTACVGGFSVPVAPSLATAGTCASYVAGLAMGSCPTACAPAGSACPPIVRGSNP